METWNLKGSPKKPYIPKLTFKEFSGDTGQGNPAIPSMGFWEMQVRNPNGELTDFKNSFMRPMLPLLNCYIENLSDCNIRVVFNNDNSSAITVLAKERGQITEYPFSSVQVYNLSETDAVAASTLKFTFQNDMASLIRYKEIIKLGLYSPEFYTVI